MRGINTCMDDIHQLTLEVQCKRYKNIVSEFREFAKRNRYIIPMGFSPREIEEKKRFYRELKEVKKKLEEMIKKR